MDRLSCKRDVNINAPEFSFEKEATDAIFSLPLPLGAWDLRVIGIGLLLS